MAISLLFTTLTLQVSLLKKAKYQITLYFPLSNEHYPAQSNIEKLSITLDWRLGML